MPESLAAGKFLRKAEKCIGVCIVKLISPWVQSSIMTETGRNRPDVNIRVEKKSGKMRGTVTGVPVTGQEHGLGQVRVHALDPEGHISADKLVL
jgi:hypothetical protein